MQLLAGVVIALVVKVLRKNKPLDGLADEAKMLFLPALMVGGGVLALGQGWKNAGTATLVSLATALGLNSTKAKDDAQAK